jgi:hypothetical protein
MRLKTLVPLCIACSILSNPGENTVSAIHLKVQDIDDDLVMTESDNKEMDEMNSKVEDSVKQSDI